MRVLLGVTGGIAAYKSAEIVAPTARARRRGAGRDDGRRAPVRHAAHLPGAVGPARAHRPLGRGRRSGDGPHRTRALGRSDPGRAGDGRLHRAPRARPRRRPAHDALPRDRRADHRRAGDEPADVGQCRDAGQRRTLALARHRDPRPRRRRPGLRRNRAGPHARAARSWSKRFSRGASACCVSGRDWPLAGARCSSPPGPTRERIDPGALHHQSQLRKDGLRGRARPRATPAPTSCS